MWRLEISITDNMQMMSLEFGYSILACYWRIEIGGYGNIKKYCEHSLTSLLWSPPSYSKWSISTRGAMVKHYWEGKLVTFRAKKICLWYHRTNVLHPSWWGLSQSHLHFRVFSISTFHTPLEVTHTFKLC